MIARLMKKDVVSVVEETSQRVRPEKSEVERLWACNKKAAKLLGWKPEFSGLEGLERGLRNTIEWFSNPENLAKYRGITYEV